MLPHQQPPKTLNPKHLFVIWAHMKLLNMKYPMEPMMAVRLLLVKMLLVLISRQN